MTSDTILSTINHLYVLITEAMPDEKMGDMSLKQLIDAATAVSHIPIQTHGQLNTVHAL